MKKLINTDIHQSVAYAPSIPRIRPISFLVSSALVGGAVFTGAMALMWRDLPLLPAPEGTLGLHMSLAFKSALNALAPSIYATERAQYSAHLQALWEQGRFWSLGVRLSVSSALAALPIGLLLKEHFTPKDGLRHIRGGQRYESRQAIKVLNKTLAPQQKVLPDHEIAPGVMFPSSHWTRHVLIVGGVGSGKSTVIRPLLQKIVTANEKLILFDPKGEFTAAFKKPVIMAPWDDRSYAWDIATDMRNVVDMRRFAASIIKEGQDPMWANAARQVLVGLMLFLKDAYGNSWGFKELAEMIVVPQNDMLDLMNKYNEEAIRAFERLSVTTTGILINLSAFCSAIFDLSSAWGNVPEDRRISISHWLLDKSPARVRQIILQGHGAYAELTKAYVDGVIGTLSALVNSVELDDDDQRKIWLVADEFAQMGNVPIRPLFEVGRSRGVRCVVATQDFSQLEAIHGKEFIKALVSMCGTTIIGRVGQGETAQILSQYIGTREVERENLSTSFGGSGPSGGKSTTVSYNRDELSLYKPTELSKRLGVNSENTGVTVLLCMAGDSYEVQYPFFSMPKERLAHVPAPWTLGVKLRQHSQSPLSPMPANLTNTNFKPDTQNLDQTQTVHIGTQSEAQGARSIHQAGQPAIELGGYELGSADLTIDAVTAHNIAVGTEGTDPDPMSAALQALLEQEGAVPEHASPSRAPAQGTSAQGSTYHYGGTTEAVPAMGDEVIGAFSELLVESSPEPGSADTATELSVLSAAVPLIVDVEHAAKAIGTLTDKDTAVHQVIQQRPRPMNQPQLPTHHKEKT